MLIYLCIFQFRFILNCIRGAVFIIFTYLHITFNSYFIQVSLGIISENVSGFYIVSVAMYVLYVMYGYENNFFLSFTCDQLFYRCAINKAFSRLRNQERRRKQEENQGKKLRIPTLWERMSSGIRTHIQRNFLGIFFFKDF